MACGAVSQLVSGYADDHGFTGLVQHTPGPGVSQVQQSRLKETT